MPQSLQEDLPIDHKPAKKKHADEYDVQTVSEHSDRYISIPSLEELRRQYTSWISQEQSFGPGSVQVVEPLGLDSGN